MKLLFYSSSLKKMTKKNSLLHHWILMFAGACMMTFGFPSEGYTQDIIINEINYDYNKAFRGYRSKDWVEIYNRGTNIVDLSNWVLADEDTLYTLPSGLTMPPDSYYIFAKDAMDFTDAHPSVNNVLESDLSFSENGETIKLYRDTMMMMLEDSVAYGDDAPWPEDPDGDGPTLSLIDPSLDNDEYFNWTSSGNYGGTPGRPNVVLCGTTPPTIIINEISYKPTALVNTKDWVELHNPNSFDVDISGWEFADERGFYSVPAGVIIPANGYHVLVQQSTAFSAFYFPMPPHSGDWGWGLDGGGEDIGLFTDDRCLVDKVDYDDDLPWPDDTDSTGYTLMLIDPALNNNLPGSWVSSSAIPIFFGTPGQPNGYPDPCNPTPEGIVINEINYNSDTIVTPGNWVELHNPSTAAVDLSGWKFYDEDSVFVIPPGTSIPPDGYMVLVEDDLRFAAAFPSVSNFVGPMGFGLSNNNERIMLYSAEQCIVDSLKYNDDSPWPEEADGEGATLALIDATLDNTAPASWAASPRSGTPGVANTLCVQPDIHAFLQGPYLPAADKMNTALNAIHKVLPGQIPANPNIAPTPAVQPYGVAPWNYMGTEGTGWGNGNYDDDIVDWVLVSYRTGTGRNTEVARTAALMLEDGAIQMVDRCALNTDMGNSLYIVVEHRNHAGIMSPTALPVVGGVIAHDFRIADSYVGPDPNNPIGAGQILLATGKYAMYAGDGDQINDVFSYDITGVDKTIWTIQNGEFSQYLPSDYDMDGDVNGNDKIIWAPNNGISSRVPR